MPSFHCGHTSAGQWPRFAPRLPRGFADLTLRACLAERGCALDGGVLFRWQCIPTKCFTFNLGLQAGHLLRLRCSRCKAVYAGPWYWPEVRDEKLFPRGHHHLRIHAATRAVVLRHTSSMLGQTSAALVFATSSSRWHHLTALYVIYSALWGHTLQSSQYATRQHFVAAVELAAWASVPSFLCAVFNSF